jgi:hypothetical protein
VGTELFHMDGQTDTKKLIVAFRCLANATKKNIVRGICIRNGGSLNKIYNRFSHPQHKNEQYSPTYTDGSTMLEMELIDK